MLTPLSLGDAAQWLAKEILLGVLSYDFLAATCSTTNTKRLSYGVIQLLHRCEKPAHLGLDINKLRPEAPVLPLKHLDALAIRAPGGVDTALQLFDALCLPAAEGLLGEAIS